MSRSVVAGSVQMTIPPAATVASASVALCMLLRPLGGGRSTSAIPSLGRTAKSLCVRAVIRLSPTIVASERSCSLAGDALGVGSDECNPVLRIYLLERERNFHQRRCLAAPAWSTECDERRHRRCKDWLDREKFCKGCTESLDAFFRGRRLLPVSNTCNEKACVMFGKPRIAEHLVDLPVRIR